MVSMVDAKTVSGQRTFGEKCKLYANFMQTYAVEYKFVPDDKTILMPLIAQEPGKKPIIMDQSTLSNIFCVKKDAHNLILSSHLNYPDF